MKTIYYKVKNAFEIMVLMSTSLEAELLVPTSIYRDQQDIETFFIPGVSKKQLKVCQRSVYLII